MTDSRLSNKMVSLLFHMRSSMVRGIKKNFSSLYRENLSCPLACGGVDEQQHLLCCPVLLAQLTIAEEQQLNMVEYDDIYGSVEEQIDVIVILSKQLEVRESLLEQKDQSLPVDNFTGPDTSTL